jgi:cystathionine beta-lyase
MSRSAADRPRDASSAVRNPFDSLSLADLRLRRSQKWRDIEPDVLPVWVSEMDFPLAEPVRDVLLQMVGPR